MDDEVRHLGLSWSLQFAGSLELEVSISPIMRSSVSEAFTFFRDNRLSTIWSRIRAREVPWLIQFGVYGFCGALSTVVFVGQVILLSKYVIPAFDGMIVDGAPITQDLRAKNLLINNSIAFFVTNLFTYVVNVLLVFKRGRHHPFAEFFYFTLVNLVSFGISQVAGPWLIHQFNIPTWAAILTNAVASALINYAARKFFVFKN